MNLRRLFLRLAIPTPLICFLAAPAVAEQWQQPRLTKSPETIACNRSDGDAHGMVCLKLECVDGRQYRFTVIADLAIVGDTTFSAGTHSITLNMEEHQSTELEGWNLSRSSVGADFLTRIAREKELLIRNLIEGSKDVPITLTKFSAELRRLGATCKEAK
jgi:hypothetical protein